MPKARHKRKTAYQTSQTRAVFLYGHPNKGKLSVLSDIERDYTKLVNDDIALIVQTGNRFIMQLILNQKKDADVRAFEKAHRPTGINAAFCQNAFDNAFTKLSNRLNAIRLDMYKADQTIFTQSKVLFAMSVLNQTKVEMADSMRELAATSKRDTAFYTNAAEQLDAMSDEAFHEAMTSFADEYTMADMLFAIPHTTREMVSLDSRLVRIENPITVKSPFIVSITNPFVKGKRIPVPVYASRDGIRRIRQYGMAGTVHFSVRKRGVLRIQASIKKHVTKPDTPDICGVDTGLTDCFYCSDGRSVGTMNQVITFYQAVVEPAFAEISKLRNKKRAILHDVRHHRLSDSVKQQLLSKVDRLEQMIRTADAPYRKKRHYYQMLNHEVSQSVQTYISGISKDTLTVIERLDIKSFDKSKKLNGKLSIFARGLLQQKLMAELNWHGYDFMEVEADYSSQTCPVCGSIHKENRHGKDFTCTCCGYHDDADHNAAVNLQMRATDKAFLDLCKKEQYHHKALQTGILALGKERHAHWQKTHQHTISQH